MNRVLCWCGGASTACPMSKVLLHAGKGLSSLFKGKTIDRLEDCFRAFTEEERLEGNEAFWCSACQARTPATKVLRIHRFPHALVLHIKRFKVAKGQHVKLSSNVAIPLQGLDLAPFASESCCLDLGAKYDLYALANHAGSLDSGHYTAHAKVAGADREQPWCLFADDKVSEVRAICSAVALLWRPDWLCCILLHLDSRSLCLDCWSWFLELLHDHHSNASSPVQL